LAPENIYIYNPPARPHDRRGPRRDRDDRRDGPPGNRSDGPVGSRSEAAEPATVAVAAAGDDASADKSDE